MEADVAGQICSKWKDLSLKILDLGRSEEDNAQIQTLMDVPEDMTAGQYACNCGMCINLYSKRSWCTVKYSYHCLSLFTRCEKCPGLSGPLPYDARH